MLVASQRGTEGKQGNEIETLVKYETGAHTRVEHIVNTKPTLNQNVFVATFENLTESRN